MNERRTLRLNTTPADEGIQAAKKENWEARKMESIKEDIEKAGHSAGFLSTELKAAHTKACTENPVLAILLIDLIRDAAKIEQRIREIQGVL